MTKCFRLSVGVIVLCLCAVSVSSYAVQTTPLPGTLPMDPDTWRDDPTGGGGGGGGGGSGGSGGGTGGGTGSLPTGWITDNNWSCSNDYECNVPKALGEEAKYDSTTIEAWANGDYNDGVPQYEVLEVTKDYDTYEIMKVVYKGLCVSVSDKFTAGKFCSFKYGSLARDTEVDYGCAPGYYGVCSDPEDYTTCNCTKCPDYRDTAGQQQSYTASSYGVNYMYASNFSVPTTVQSCYFQPTASYYTNSKGRYTIPSVCPYQ